jgi:hypothetical protein
MKARRVHPRVLRGEKGTLIGWTESDSPQDLGGIHMYVRWKKRSLKTPGEYALDAVLVRSKWIGGQAKQEFAAHLGTFNDIRWNPAYASKKFWDSVDRILPQVVPDETTRLKIERQLLGRVQRQDWDAFLEGRLT